MIAPNVLLQNRYLIDRLLAQGGMGAVYLAHDQRLGIAVAVKETLSSDDSSRKQFEREARLLAKLRHPALPVVSDHFVEGEGQFLVMQFIPGDDLEEILLQRSSPFSTDEVLARADQLLDALDYLHTQPRPIVHRDIKPQNLKLTERGQIILLDFGLAKGLSLGTSTSSVFGYTPSYAPLEQIQCTGTEPRSDLYSLAATLYYLLTGITSPNAVARAAAVLSKRPDPFIPANEVNKQVPPDVARVLTQAMALDIERRPSSAAEMRGSLWTARGVISPQQEKKASGDASTKALSNGSTIAALSVQKSEALEGGKVVGEQTNAKPSATLVGILPMRWRAKPLLWVIGSSLIISIAGVIAYLVVATTQPALPTAIPNPHGPTPNAGEAANALAPPADNPKQSSQGRFVEATTFDRLGRAINEAKLRIEATGYSLSLVTPDLLVRRVKESREFRARIVVVDPLANNAICQRERDEDNEARNYEAILLKLREFYQKGADLLGERLAVGVIDVYPTMTVVIVDDDLYAYFFPYKGYGTDSLVLKFSDYRSNDRARFFENHLNNIFGSARFLSKDVEFNPYRDAAKKEDPCIKR